jgi:hypothetical protein
VYWKALIAVVACVVGFGVAPARAQSEAVIRARLVAEADGSVITQGAVVLRSVVTDVPIQGRVDPGGWWTFRNVSPGEYILTGVSDGFSSRNLRLVVEPREVRTVGLPLSVAGVDVSVTVSAEGAPLPSTHSPSSTVLASERIENLPVSQRLGLPDAIVTAAPGMVRGHDDFVHIRGEEVALNPLINGVAFWENTHAVFSAGLSPDVIDTANVMTGGFPAEYGNRFGGIVDIVTKSGFRVDNSGSVTVSAGEAGRRNLLGEFGGHRGRVGYYASGSMFESDRFLSPPAPDAIHDRARGGHGFVQLDVDLGRRGLLRTLVMGGGANFEIPITPQDVALRPQARADQRTRQQTAIVGWMRAWSGLTLDATLYQRWSRARLLPARGPLTAQASLMRELGTLGGKVDVTRLVGRHALKAGVDAVRLRPDEEIAYEYAGFREFTHLLGLPHMHITDDAIRFLGRGAGGQVSGYVQDDVRLGRRLTANAGVRVDRHHLVVSATHASPRLNLALEVGGGAVLHASYNHFFVPPPIEGVLSSAAGLTARIREIGVGLPAVQPTTEDQFELGASTPAGPLQLGITGYYRVSDNPVHTTVWPDARIYSYASFDRARAHGLEARADIPGLARYGLTGYFNYALGRVHFYGPVTGGFITEAYHLDDRSPFLAPMDQTHTLTSGLTYRHARTGLWIGAAMEYGSGTPVGHGDDDHAHPVGEAAHAHAESVDGAARVPGHVTADVSFGIDLVRGPNRRPRWSFQIDVENAGNNVYLVARESEFTPGQYSIPRLVSATAKVRF